MSIDVNQLAFEYNKLKQAYGQMKQALIDERTKSVSLEKHQSELVQAHSSEIERFQFDIQRLTKRIIVLQEDLSKEQKSKGGTPMRESGSGLLNLLGVPSNNNNNNSSNSNSNSNSNSLNNSTNSLKSSSNRIQDDSGVLKAELAKKTEEIVNIKSGYEETIKLLQTKINSLQDVVRKGYEEFDTSSKDWMQTKKDLETKNGELTQMVNEFQSKLSRIGTQVQERDSQLIDGNRKLNQELVESQTLIRNKLPFDDTVNNELNKLNLAPSFSEDHSDSNFLGKLMPHIESTIFAFDAFYLNFQQRIQLINRSSVLSEQSRIINRKFILLISDSLFLNSPQTSINATDLLNVLISRLKFADEFCKLHIEKFAVEANLNNSEVSAETKLQNSKLKDSFVDLQQFVFQILGALTNMSLNKLKDPKTIQVFFPLMLRVSKSWNTILKLNEQFNSQSQSSSTGGTNSQSGALNINFNFVLPALKEANQSFQNSLKKATTSLDSLLNNAESLNISMSLSNSTVVAVRGAFVDLTSANTTFGSTIPVLLQNSTSFMSKANLQSVPTNAYDESKVAALSDKSVSLEKENKALWSSVSIEKEKTKELEKRLQEIATELSNLKGAMVQKDGQLSNLQNLLNQFQQQSALSLNNESNQEITVIRASPSVNPDSLISFHENDPHSENGNYKIKVQNGSKTEESLGITDETKEREMAIRSYYQIKMKQFTTELKSMDNRLRKLYKLYKQVLDSVNRVNSENQSFKSQLQSSTEDLNDTRKNYEKQLSVLSEHMSTLNDQVSKQSAQMEQLRFRTTCQKCQKPLSNTTLKQ